MVLVLPLIEDTPWGIAVHSVKTILSLLYYSIIFDLICVNHSPADEEVHGWVEVLVLYYSCDDQNVLQQGDDTQDQKDLRRIQDSVTGGGEVSKLIRWSHVEWLPTPSVVNPNNKIRNTVEENKHLHVGVQCHTYCKYLYSNMELLACCRFWSAGLVR